MASPADDAVTVNCAGPVPESGDTVSQFVTKFEGDTFAVHAGEPPLKPRLTVDFCEEPPLVKLTEAGETEATMAADADDASVVEAVVLTTAPDCDWVSMPLMARLLAPAAAPLSQHNLPWSLPKGAMVVVPKICCNWLLKSVVPDVSVDNRMSYPPCSSSTSGCGHRQDGSAVGSGGTVAGVVSRSEGATSSLDVKGTVICCDHATPLASVPVNPNTIFVGALTVFHPREAEIDPFAGMADPPNQLLMLDE